MARVKEIDPDDADAYITKVFAAQSAKWGAPLLNHLVYARRPALFKSVRAMWAAVNEDGLLEPSLVHLVNRRIAAINNCAF